ncbi:MAG: diguanylate cyclase [bacterium]|nr:diguanylate cyclase [bacterium]
MSEKILIADDSTTIVEMLRFFLEKEGYVTVVAKDGIEAIEQAYRELPDLMLLDVLMPKMNGYQVCRLLKGDENISYIPVIMLTSQDQPKDKFWGLQTGADEYIIKDFESDELFNSIIRVLEKSKKQREKKPLEAPQTTIDNILYRLNGLLDKKLFQTTILNELNSIARTQDNCEDVIKEILGLLNRVVNYHLGAVLIEQNEMINIMLYENQPVSESFITESLTNITEAETTKAGFSIRKDNLKVTTVKSTTTRTKGNYPERAKSHLTIPMRAHKSIIGILYLATTFENAFNAEIIELLDIITNEASIVINNAMFYDEFKLLAITDGLTKCYNHRYFQEILENEFQRAKRYKLTFSLLIGDIDNFKKINDTYGHQIGDVVLKGISSLLKRVVRDIDVVARYGGEEFTVIMPETDSKGAAGTAERIRQAIEEYIFSGLPPKTYVTMSIGVGTYPDLKVADKFEFIEKIDKALYRAKREGKNRVCQAD